MRSEYDISEIRARKKPKKKQSDGGFGKYEKFNITKALDSIRSRLDKKKY